MPIGRGRIAALARRVRSLVGWRRRLVALLAGAASVLAMAPFFAWPVLWITLTVLVWLIDGASPAWRGADAAGRRVRADHLIAAAGAGWWFGFGYFLAGLFWVGEAFLVEAATFAVLLPFAVTLLPAGMALYWGGAAALAARFWSARPCRVLVLALALSAAEWLRGHLLTGFPWNLLGYALTYPLPLMQSAALVGVYGLTLVAVIVFALPPVAWSEAPAGEVGRRRRAGALALAVVPIAMMATLGAVRLARADAATVPGVKVRIVQPSVPQREKWRPEHQERIFLEHLRLSATNPAGETDSAGITHIIWPEAALPFLVLDHPAARAAIGRSLPRGALLIAGALRAEPAPAGSARPRRIFNSLLVLGEGGSLVGLYDKTHLVPFGEYLPLQGLLRSVGLGWLVGMRGGFDIGVTPRPLLSAPGLPPAAPLICYEAIFPAAVVQGPQRPGLLLNVTNDGWFGDTTGPRQHLHQARVRAVEEGLPLLRAANNGVSAAIDGYGHILARLDLDVRGVIDAPVPAALPPPPYARLGDLTLLLLWLAVAGTVALCMRR
ncbi:MAG TPA: apolipoprotein N-acyltransferase [Hyphomicrobiaceae bacterium]|nr:apolipoprotein N-acyltransferase [Hyphomicrobiaceae bacterium]